MKHWKLNNSNIGLISVIFSALFYAICVPFAKILSSHIQSAVLGGLLYLGAGVGLLFTMVFKKSKPELKFSKSDSPFLIAMVLLDITAIICLMAGLTCTTASNASLLNNFELVVTSLAAYFFFKEKITLRLWSAITLITAACIVLSFSRLGAFMFGFGSVLVLLSTICWGLENNCTRQLSIKDTRQITIIKGCFSGVGSLVIALIVNQSFAPLKWCLYALGLGFISYGLSVCLYVYAQRFLGAAKSASFFALAPFMGVVFSFLILGETPSKQFYLALVLMVLGTILVIRDTQNS